MKPLNPWLYSRLDKLYGPIKVLKEGQQAIYRTAPGQNGLKGKIVEDGENYAICCPFCTDTRFRLCVSYLYGSTLRSEDGRLISFPPLAYCFNETHCMDKKAYREDLFRALVCGEMPMLFQPKGRAERKSKQIVYPQKLIPIDELPSQHQAVKYLKDRNFDISHLARVGFHFCPEDPYPLIENRIFIPIFDVNGNLSGGQCRLPFDVDSTFPPKYYTLEGSKLNQCLYNSMFANEELVVVTEGVFDALRLKNHGVAVCGSSLSRYQINQLRAGWSYILIAFDSDLEKKDKKTYNKLARVLDQLRQAGKWASLLKLPADTDPADLNEGELWNLIQNKLSSPTGLSKQ